MPWEIDDARALEKMSLVSETDIANYHTWANFIRNGGDHPRIAAERLGDSHYERMKGTRESRHQYTIRLNGSERVSFLIHKSINTVEVLQIGGHP
ncbi:hypothetical protein [Xenorhabdus bovienii]|uniref:hypothetical protein n=1 Tax=Xenorhabdus bovienii TaxID=40576 RepID=UPI00237D31F5|nr:hypothetical protein [Xenorhabdus bovienii]MDE1493117.1 hypothetical protein [Xenorhabdus bovienii]MDE9528210.1 hypothetical protein [Xenorhabdus bovienii]MDE9571396.1 hypothetical protein [Xenorhabdus bovienii]